MQIKEQILVRELNVGDELPSVRDLGDALGISLHTARSAYQVLAEEGLLRIRLGKKARIAAVPGTIGWERFADDFALRVRELIVDGLLQGSELSDLHRLLDAEHEALVARGAGTKGKDSA